MWQKHIFLIYTFHYILLPCSTHLLSYSFTLFCDNCLSLSFRKSVYAYVFFPTYSNCIDIYIDRVPKAAYCLLHRLLFFLKFWVSTSIKTFARLIYHKKSKPIFLYEFHFQTTKFKSSSLRCEWYMLKQCVIMTQ